MQMLIKGGHVIDVEDRSVSKVDILIEDNKIIEIASNIDIKDAIQVVDCHGKWIIPGLIDMHVHIKMGFAPLFTSSGITTVRNTAGSVIELRDMMESQSTANTPRVISADRLIDGPPGLWGETSPYNLNTIDEQEARQEVQRQVTSGADFIKVYGLLNKNVMAAVVDEASKHNKGVSCDLIHSSKVNAVDAAEMGIEWNEHASGVVQAMYPQWSMRAEESIWHEVDWQEPDENLIRNICQKLLKHKVKLCPTMIIFDQANLLDTPWKATNPVIQKAYENEGLINQWKMLSQHTSALKLIGMQHKMIKKIAKIYHDLGGIVVAGTDTPAGIFTYPGMALHRELELFVESGFTEMEALRAATIVAADAMNRQDIGSINTRKVADIVVLHENPLIDIRHTQTIAHIIKGGKLFSQEQLLETVPTAHEIQQHVEELIAKFTELGMV